MHFFKSLYSIRRGYGCEYPNSTVASLWGERWNKNGKLRQELENRLTLYTAKHLCEFHQPLLGVCTAPVEETILHHIPNEAFSEQVDDIIVIVMWKIVFVITGKPDGQNKIAVYQRLKQCLLKITLVISKSGVEGWVAKKRRQKMWAVSDLLTWVKLK